MAATRKTKRFDRREFIQVQQAWAVIDPLFDELMDAYKAATKKMKAPRPLLKHWRIPRSVLEMWDVKSRERILLMQNMSRTYQVLSSSLLPSIDAIIAIHVYTHPQSAKAATLDELPFTTVKKQSAVTTDNSYVFEEYIHRDTGAKERCYGRIQSIVEHDMYPGCPDTLRHVLIECDWYTPTAVQPCGGLLQVSFDAPMSKANRWTFLHNMHRSNVVLWPAYAHDPSFAVIDSTFFVIQHTVAERDNEKEDPDDVVEEGDDDVHAEDGSESEY